MKFTGNVSLASFTKAKRPYSSSPRKGLGLVRSGVVDDGVGRLRRGRLRELDADVDHLVGGQVAGEVVDDGPEGEPGVLVAAQVAGVVEHPVRRAVVRADREGVALALP